MMQWLQTLTPEQQVMIAALAAAWVTQAVKWGLAKAGRKLDDTSSAKAQKLVLAAATAALTTLLVTGPTGAFWGKWLGAFAGAIFSHEVFWKLLDVGKETAATKEAN